MKDLEQCRAEIDAIDRQLVKLFEQRMDVCRQVGEYKKEKGLPVLDAAREREVLAAKAALLEDPTLKAPVASLFENIMASSRMLQEQLVAEPDPVKARELEEYLRLRNWQGEPLKQQRVLYQGQDRRGSHHRRVSGDNRILQGGGPSPPQAVKEPCHCEPARTLAWQSVLQMFCFYLPFWRISLCYGNGFPRSLRSLGMT